MELYYPQHIQELENAFLIAKKEYEKQREQLKKRIEIEFVQQFGPANGQYPYTSLDIVVLEPPTVTIRTSQDHYVNRQYKSFIFKGIKIKDSPIFEPLLELSFTYHPNKEA